MDMKQKYFDYFSQLEKDSEKNKVYETLCKDQAMEALENKEVPFPVVFSDLFSTKGIRTTANSKMLENYLPPFNATVVERVDKAGGIILGKSKGREFGVGHADQPFGTSAAVAHGEDIVGFSTSYKGSVQMGAQAYGLFAYQPTYGLVSRYGIIPVASSMDRVGIQSKGFDNLPKALDLVAGKDEKDSSCLDCEIDFSNLEEMDLTKLRFVSISGDLEGVQESFEKSGLSMESLQIDGLKYALPAYDIISSGEFATNMQRFDGISFGYRSDNYNNVEELYKNSRTEGLGQAVQEKIMLGNFVLSEGKYGPYYVQAMKARTMIKENLEKEMETYEFIVGSVNLDTLVALDLAGLPSLFIPFGKEGFLITTKAFNDKRLLEFGKALVSRMEGDQ